MSNKKFTISKEAHNLLLELNAILNINKNPTTILLAISKAIAVLDEFPEDLNIYSKTGGWTVPNDVITGNDYLLYKHLIIQELGTPISDHEITPYLSFLVEYGLRILFEQTQERVALQDAKLAILE